MTLPRLGHVGLAVAALLVLATNVLVVAALWIAQRPVNPISESHLIAIDPANRVLHRSGPDSRESFTIKRRICSRRTEDVNVRREWQEAMPDGLRPPVVMWDMERRSVQKGCHDYDTVYSVPRTQNSGLYVLQVTIEACNPLGRCRDWFLEPLQLQLVDPPTGAAMPGPQLVGPPAPRPPDGPERPRRR